MATENRTGILESWKGILEAVRDDRLRLLALVVLVAEAVMATAMNMTPDSSPLKSWYPVFMLLFLLVLVVFLFFDRQQERDYLHRGIMTLNPEDRKVALLTLIGIVDTAADKAPKAEQTRLQQTRQVLEADLASLAPEAKQARKQLQELAQDYEEIRRDMKPSSGRTLKLTAIVTQASALAKQAGYDSTEVGELFAGNSEGARIVSLAIVKAMPNLNFFDLVLQSISNSRSAFEQYQALRAMEHLLPQLNADQKQKLANVLKNQRSGGPGKFITPDSDRWLLSNRLLDVIQQ